MVAKYFSMYFSMVS